MCEPKPKAAMIANEVMDALYAELAALRAEVEKLRQELADEYSADAQIQEMAAAKDAEIEKLTQERDEARREQWKAETWLSELPDGFISALSEAIRHIEDGKPKVAYKQLAYCRDSLRDVNLDDVLTWKERAEVAEAALAAAPEESR